MLKIHDWKIGEGGDKIVDIWQIIRADCLFPNHTKNSNEDRVDFHEIAQRMNSIEIADD